MPIYNLIAHDEDNPLRTSGPGQYDINGCDGNPDEHGRKLVEYYNHTLRPGETARVFVGTTIADEKVCKCCLERRGCTFQGHYPGFAEHGRPDCTCWCHEKVIGFMFRDLMKHDAEFRIKIEDLCREYVEQCLYFMAIDPRRANFRRQAIHNMLLAVTTMDQDKMRIFTDHMDTWGLPRDFVLNPKGVIDDITYWIYEIGGKFADWLKENV